MGAAAPTEHNGGRAEVLRRAIGAHVFRRRLGAGIASLDRTDPPFETRQPNGEQQFLEFADPPLELKKL